MIVVSISHRNRQQRRAMARALAQRGRRIAGLTPHQIRVRFAALTNYMRGADPAALAALGLADDRDHALLAYVVDRSQAEPDTAGAGEKVDLIGYRNVTPDFDRAQTEMRTLIAKARGKDPIEHYVISWDEGERPTPDQVEEAVDMLMHVLDLEEHGAIYAAHSNTRHYHVHLAVNRIHPGTGRLVAAGGGWQLNAMQQAAAWIEHRQGWEAEKNALYRANAAGVHHIESGRLVRLPDGRATGTHPPDRRTAEKPVAQRLSRGAREYEHRTGLESFERIAMTVAAPIIMRARSWPELHAGLAEEGLGYAPYGTNGARITMGERAIPASIAARGAAITQLAHADRLGPFLPGTPERIVPRKPRYFAGQDRRPDYETARTRHRSALADARERLAAQRAHARATIVAWRATFAARIDAAGWRGRREALNATRALFALHFQAIERDLMAATGPAIAALDRASRFPSYAAWCAGAAVPSIPQALDLTVPMLIAGSADHAATGTLVAGYDCRRHDTGCSYRLVRSLQPAFTDRGPTLSIHSIDRADVTAALKLAQAKWGIVELISGTEAFVRMAVDVAGEEGITLTGKLARRHARVLPKVEAAPAKLLPVDEMRGIHPLVDAWIVARQRDPAALATLRPLAAAAQADPTARSLITQWLAEGLPAAQHLRQQATYHTRMQAAAHATTMANDPGLQRR